MATASALVAFVSPVGAQDKCAVWTSNDRADPVVFTEVVDATGVGGGGGGGGGGCLFGSCSPFGDILVDVAAAQPWSTHDLPARRRIPAEVPVEARTTAPIGPGYTLVSRAGTSEVYLHGLAVDGCAATLIDVYTDADGCSGRPARITNLVAVPGAADPVVFGFPAGDCGGQLFRFTLGDDGQGGVTLQTEAVLQTIETAPVRSVASIESDTGTPLVLVSHSSSVVSYEVLDGGPGGPYLMEVDQLDDLLAGSLVRGIDLGLSEPGGALNGLAALVTVNVAAEPDGNEVRLYSMGSDGSFTVPPISLLSGESAGYEYARFNPGPDFGPTSGGPGPCEDLGPCKLSWIGWAASEMGCKPVNTLQSGATVPVGDDVGPARDVAWGYFPGDADARLLFALQESSLTGLSWLVAYSFDTAGNVVRLRSQTVESNLSSLGGLTIQDLP